MAASITFIDDTIADGDRLTTDPNWTSWDQSGTGRPTSDQHSDHCGAANASDQVIDMSTVGVSWAMHSTALDSVDMTVETNVWPDDDGHANTGMGVLARLQTSTATSTPTCYRAIASPRDADGYVDAILYRVVSGVSTEIARAGPVGPLWTSLEDDFGLRLVVSGTGATVTCEVWVEDFNGGTFIKEIDYADTDAARITTGVYTGRYFNRSPATTDGQPFSRNFYAEALSVGPAPVEISGTGSASVTVSDTAALTVTTLSTTVTPAGSASVTVSDTAALTVSTLSITDYVVEYRTTAGPGAWQTFNDGVSASTGATVTGLTAGVSYDFRVAAVNAIGTGAWSNVVTVVPDNTIVTINPVGSASVTVSDTAALTVTTLTGPVIDPVGSASVTVSDTAALTVTTLSITDYVVEYRTTAGPGVWEAFNDGVSASTGATVTGLTAGISYDFRVAAVNTVGTGAWSNVVTVVPDNTSVAINPVGSASVTVSDTAALTVTTLTGPTIDPVGSASVTVSDTAALTVTTLSGPVIDPVGSASVTVSDTAALTVTTLTGPTINPVGSASVTVSDTAALTVSIPSNVIELKLGDTQVLEIALGDTLVAEAYLGDTLIVG